MPSHAAAACPCLGADIRCLVTRCRPVLTHPTSQLADELRERAFGDYELQSTSNYELVWAEDARDPGSRPPGEGGESVEDVAARTAAFVQRLERQHGGKAIVLVGHGDGLSILAAALLGTDLRRHRQHGLPNCGILRLPLSPGSQAASAY